MGGQFGCIQILAHFKEQDLKFGSFGNLSLKYTLDDMHRMLSKMKQTMWCQIGKKMMQSKEQMRWKQQTNKQGMDAWTMDNPVK